MNLSNLLNIIWVLFLLSTVLPLLNKRAVEARRRMVMDAIERKRGSRLITLIHRQETMSLLGIPISRYIDIEDSEQVLRAIRLTDEKVPIDMVLHTPGGLVLAAEQIACALSRHPAKVTVFVPHYAMSGGTLVAMAADEIVMDPNGVLGPVDPQLQMPQGGGYVPAVSVLAAVEVSNPNRDDQTLMMADMARKAIQQVHNTVFGLLQGNGMEEGQARALAERLSSGCWTHDYPISASEAREMGLPVSEDMPKEIYTLMDLYPQAGQRRPSVEFIPTPYGPSPGRPGQGEPKP
jgi:ClpP class serine protease